MLTCSEQLIRDTIGGRLVPAQRAGGFLEWLGGSRILPGKSTGLGGNSAPAFVKLGWILRGLIKPQGRHSLTILEALGWKAEI